MNTEVYGILVFKSTHYTIGAESVFRDKEISFKTIPTPREISLSCGLAIIFALDDLEKVKEAMDSNQIKLAGIYRYTRNGIQNKYEKII
ncbi:MAG: DUF3343 domain-containing protein [Tissierellaceae bacterium]